MHTLRKADIEGVPNGLPSRDFAAFCGGAEVGQGLGDFLKGEDSLGHSGFCVWFKFGVGGVYDFGFGQMETEIVGEKRLWRWGEDL